MNSNRILEIGIYSFVTKALQTTLFFAAQVVASRWLLKEHFGQAQYILWMSSLSWMLFHLGIPSVFARFLPVLSLPERVVLMKRSIWVLLCALLMGLMFTLPQVVPVFREHWMLTAVLVIAHAANAFLSAAATGLLQNKQLFKAQIPAGIVLLGWMYAQQQVFTTACYVQAVLLYYMVYIVLLLIVLKIGIHTYAATESSANLPEGPVLLRISLTFYASALLAAIVWQRTEVIVLGKWFSSEALADYTVALTLTALFTEPVRWVTSAYTSYFAGSKESDAFYLQLHSISWSITWFLSAFAWFFADEIILWAYGNRYAQAGLYMQWLIPVIAAGVSAYPTMSFHTGRGKSRFLFLQDALTALLFLLLLAYTVIKQDINFVFYAKGAAIFFSVLTGMYYTYVYMKIQYRIKALLLPVVFTVCCSIIWYVLSHLAWLVVLPLSTLLFLVYGWLLIKTGCVTFYFNKN